MLYSSLYYCCLLSRCAEFYSLLLTLLYCTVLWFCVHYAVWHVQFHYLFIYYPTFAGFPNCRIFLPKGWTVLRSTNLLHGHCAGLGDASGMVSNCWMRDWIDDGCWVSFEGYSGYRDGCSCNGNFCGCHGYRAILISPGQSYVEQHVILLLGAWENARLVSLSSHSVNV